VFEAWDINASFRHTQILEGKDITFSKLSLPEILGLVQSLDGYGSFSVLDVGCGTGILTQIIARYVRRVVGIDPSNKSVLIAREYTKGDENVTIECASIEEYARDHPSQFDLVVAHMTLQTVNSLQLVLRSTAHVLKRTGTFVFSIPHPCFFAEHTDFDCKSDYQYHIPALCEIPFTISRDPIPLPSRVPYHHRPLEVYSSALLRAGLCIVEIREPFPSSELMKEYPVPWKYPHVLIGVCSRLGTA